MPAEADAIRDGVRRVLAGESVHAITKSRQASVPPVRYGTWPARAPLGSPRTAAKRSGAGPGR